MTLQVRTRLLCISSLFIFISACSEPQQENGALPPFEVDVALPLQQSITEWDEYTGRFEAVNEVIIRPRVTGYITEKRFTDGQVLEKGDPLFIIDPRPFEYALEQAQAAFNLAKSEYERAQNLRQTRAIAQEDLERREQEFRNANALLNNAKLDLEFTTVVSPIDGRVGQAEVDAGNLARENETMLVRVVSLDPIHFEFEGSQTQLLKYIRLDRSGERGGSDRNPNPLFIKLQDENTYIHPGRVDFIDNVVDADTGTIGARALVPNPDQILYPGLFGRARLVGRSNYSVLLLPQVAIQTDQNRKFVYVVNEDDQANRAYIEIGTMLDNGLIPVTEGLSADDRVVVAGVQRIRAPEQPVSPISTEIIWVDTGMMPSIDGIPSIAEMYEAGVNKARPTSIGENQKETSTDTDGGR